MPALAGTPSSRFLHGASHDVVWFFYDPSSSCRHTVRLFISATLSKPLRRIFGHRLSRPCSVTRYHPIARLLRRAFEPRALLAPSNEGVRDSTANATFKTLRILICQSIPSASGAELGEHLQRR